MDWTVPEGTRLFLINHATYDNVVNEGTIHLNGPFSVTVNGTYSGSGNFTVGSSAPAYPLVLSTGAIFKSNVTTSTATSVFQQTWFNFVADGSNVTFNGSLDVGNGTSNPNNRYAFSMKNGGRFVLGPAARINNNLPDSINARAVFVYADSNANNVFEFDPDFDADISKDFALADGISVLRLGGGSATFISHASKNLPTIRKLANTTPVTNTHHGVLSFAHGAADVARWIVRTNEQSYDGQLSFSNPTTITTEQNLTVDGLFHPGANVGWLSSTLVTKNGGADLVLVGDQAHKPGSSIRVTQGSLRVLSDPGTPVSWDAATGRNLSLDLRGTGRVSIETPLARVTSVAVNDNATLDVNVGRTLDVSSGVQLIGGIVVGTGNVTATIAQSGGSISPGDHVGVGALKINGSFSSTGGTIRIDVSSSVGNDRLDVCGTASLAGTEIEVARVGTFVPIPGDAWTVATFANGSGAVVAANLTGFAGLRFLPEWTTTSLSLRASARPGDANLDGAVNFDDLLILASRYNVGPGETWLTGDFDRSGTVNFDDLLLLAANYNAPASAAGDWALARAVPEPAAATVLAVAPFALRRTRRPRLM